MTPDQLWSDLRSMQYHIEHKKDKIFGRYFFQYLTQINHQANNNTFREHQYSTIKSWCHNKTHSFAIHLCKSLLLNNKHTCKARALSSAKRIHAHIVTMLQFLNTEVEMWCFRSNTKVRHCLQCGSWYLCSRLVICPTSQRVICTNQDFTTALYNVCTDMTNESTVL